MSFFLSPKLEATSWKDFAEKYPDNKLAEKIKTSPLGMTQIAFGIKQNMNDPNTGAEYMKKYNLPEEAKK